jgi:hypothetical protein
MQPDIENLQTTKSEKLLAVVFAVFLLIGGEWAYTQIPDLSDAAISEARATSEERAAIARQDAAQRRLFEANRQVGRARRQVEFAREEFRAAIDARRPAAQLERRYRAAQARLTRAQAAQGPALRAVQEATPPARAARQRIEGDAETTHDRRELATFLLRLLFVASVLAIGYWLLARLRDRSSRYLPLAGATLIFGVLFALRLAWDYLTDYLDRFNLALLVLSVLGCAATITAFWALQRYLARRLPQRRVRKRQCPFCGYPVGQTERCDGCGRVVIADCAACGNARRVGTPFCGVCGAA